MIWQTKMEAQMLSSGTVVQVARAIRLSLRVARMIRG